MIVRHMARHGQPHDPLGRRHGARPGREYRPQQEGVRMDPDAVRNEWRKGRHNQEDLRRQVWHGTSSLDRVNVDRVH